MPNLVTLRPGSRGTIRLMREYGDRLIFVRYRYNPETRTRCKTVELIIEEKRWNPRRSSPAGYRFVPGRAKPNERTDPRFRRTAPRAWIETFSRPREKEKLESAK